MEFEEAESVQRLLGGARHFKNDQHMPIETPFLFLPRIDNGRYSRREERLPPEKEHLLYRELPRNPDRLVTDLVKAANVIYCDSLLKCILYKNTFTIVCNIMFRCQHRS